MVTKLRPTLISTSARSWHFASLTPSKLQSSPALISSFLRALKEVEVEPELHEKAEKEFQEINILVELQDARTCESECNQACSNTGLSTDAVEQKKGEYALIQDAEDPQLGTYDRPLPCFGCGIGWSSLLLGFICPLTWYFATILYFGDYYRKDPRERSGLAASAIAALICTVVVVITTIVLLLCAH